MAHSGKEYGDDNGLRGYVWDYFQLHAAQRLTTFNFYIALSTLITTGLFASFHESFGVPSLGIVLGLLLVVFSFVFFKLEQRNRHLIWHGEAALKRIEEGFAEGSAEAEDFRVFLKEQEETNTRKAAHRPIRDIWTYPYSYSNCFNIVFWVFALLGLTGAIVSADVAGRLTDAIRWFSSAGPSG